MPDHEILTSSKRKAAQRAAILSQLFAVMMTMVVAGQYMMLYASDVLGFSPQKIALIFSLAPFASIFRLPSLPYVQRFGLVRSLGLARVGQVIVILALIAIPAERMTWLALAGLILLFVSFRELGLGTVWQPLMRHITTLDDRGVFFGRLRAAFTTANLTLTAAIAVFVGQSFTESQFKWVLFVALLGAVNSLFWSRSIPEPVARHDLRVPSPGRAARHVWFLLRRSRLFRLPLLLTLVFTCGQVPISIVYFREALYVPASILGAQLFFTTLGQALSLIVWGKVSDSLGFRPMLAGLMSLSSVMLLILWLVAPFPAEDVPFVEMMAANGHSVAALMVFGFVGGVLNAGVGIGITAATHYHVTSRDSLTTLNLFALFQLFFQAALTLGLGALLEHVVVPGRAAGGDVLFDWYKAFAAGVVPALMLLSIPLALRLPNLKPWFNLSDFFSALRYMPWRTLLGSRLLHDEDEQRRAGFARALGESPNPLNIEPLTELLQDPSFDVKLEAIGSFARLRMQVSADRLESVLLDQERRWLWDRAAWGLGELGYPSAVGTLIQRISTDNPNRVRAMAARALGKVGDAAAVLPLLAVLRSPEENLHVLAGCCWALLKLDAQEHAEHAFRGLVRLHRREDRYELLSILSRWLGVTDRWLVISDSRTTAWASLRDFFETFPEGWEAQTDETLPAFLDRNARAVEAALTRSLDTKAFVSDRPARALLSVMRETEDWSSLHTLATAYLVLGEAD